MFGPVTGSSPGHDAARLAMVQGLDLPATETILARADSLPAVPQSSIEALLYDALGVSGVPADAIPVAPLTYRGDGREPGTDWILRADPVSLQPGAGDLTLSMIDGLRLSQTDAGALCREINGHFDEPDWKLEPLTAERWYVRCAQARDLTSVAPIQALGLHIDPFVPRGADAGALARWLNEVQMLLHASAVNVQRAGRGELPINSLWLWGGGFLPTRPERETHDVWADHVFAVALAAHCGDRWYPRPRDATAWLETMDESRREHVIVIDQALAFAQQVDIESWRVFLGELEIAWLAPLADALRQGRLTSIEIHDGTARSHRLRRASIRKWWRRRQSIARYMT